MPLSGGAWITRLLSLLVLWKKCGKGVRDGQKIF